VYGDSASGRVSSTAYQNCVTQFHDLYSSTTIVRVIKSRRMRWRDMWVGLGREEAEACTAFWWGNRRERDQWGDLGVDGRILRWVFEK
jgi:hypothetical protein